MQNRLLTKAGADGTVNYTYDAVGNLLSDGTFTHTYNAQNRLVKGENTDGESSSYTYNALGVRIENEQIRENQNAGNQNTDLKDGSHDTDYLPFLSDLRATWQRAWETQVGTVVQNDFETVTKHYIADYLSPANRDILVTEDGRFTQRYAYDADGKRLSVELGYADGTARGATNTNGEYGENPQSDVAASIGKAWYRTSHLNSTLFAVEADGSVVAHMIYDPWGAPLLETYTDTNYSGLDNANNFTGYTWDEVLGLYFAQNRFYDSEVKRFTQEDVVKDGANWYVYCGNGPTVFIDYYGLFRNGDLLYKGAENNKADVKALQKRLNDFASILGYDRLDVNGQFDLATKRAVNKYKDTYLPGGNMGANRGKVGYTTWTHLGLPMERPNTLTGIVPELLFSWDSRQGIWYSPLYVAQRPFGYNTVYDGVFTLANDVSVKIDRDSPAVDYLYFKSEFTYSGKEWKIEGWKGQYLNMGIGAEIGIYYRIPKTATENTSYFELAGICLREATEHYWSVDDKNMLYMQYTVYNGPKASGRIIFTKELQKHWWLNGFRPNYNVLAKDLTIDGRIYFPSYEMAISFMAGIDNNSGSGANNDTKNFKYSSAPTRVKSIDGTLTYYKVSFIWGQ